MPAPQTWNDDPIVSPAAAAPPEAWNNDPIVQPAAKAEPNIGAEWSSDPIVGQDPYQSKIAKDALDPTIDPSQIFASVNPREINVNNPSGDVNNPAWKSQVEEYDRQKAVQQYAIDLYRHKALAAPKTLGQKAAYVGETAEDLLPHYDNLPDTANGKVVGALTRIGGPVAGPAAGYAYNKATGGAPLELNVGGILHGLNTLVQGAASTLQHTVDTGAIAGLPGILIHNALPKNPESDLRQAAFNEGIADVAYNRVTGQVMSVPGQDVQAVGEKAYDLANGTPQTDEQIRDRLEAHAETIRNQNKTREALIDTVKKEVGAPEDAQLTPEAQEAYNKTKGYAESVANPELLAFSAAGPIARGVGESFVRPVAEGLRLPAAVTATKAAAKSATGATIQGLGKSVNTIGNLGASKLGQAATNAAVGVGGGALAASGIPGAHATLGASVGGIFGALTGGAEKGIAGPLWRKVAKAGSGIQNAGRKFSGGYAEDGAGQLQLNLTPKQSKSALAQISANPMAQNALAGAVFSLPFAAAANTPEEAADELGTGMAFAFLGTNNLSAANQGLRKLVQQKYADLAPDRYGPVEVNGQKLDLDSGHDYAMASMSPDKKLAIQSMRGFLPGAQVYALKRDDKVALLRAIGQPEGVSGIYDAPQITTEAKINGKTQKIIILDADLAALNHEPGHYIFDSLEDGTKSDLLNHIGNLPPQILQDAYVKYVNLLARSFNFGEELPKDSFTVDENGNAAMSDKLDSVEKVAVQRAIDHFDRDPLTLAKEYIAENFNDLANGESLAGHTGNKSLAQGLSDAFSEFQRTVGGEGRTSALGFKVDTQLQDKLRGILKDIAARRQAEGKITPQAPPEAPGAPATPIAPKTPPTPNQTPPAPVQTPNNDANFQDAELAARKLRIGSKQIKDGLKAARDEGIIETEDIVKRILQGNAGRPVAATQAPLAGIQEPAQETNKPANLAGAVQEGNENAAAMSSQAQGKDQNFSPTQNGPRQAASVPIMITARMEADLKAKGYSQAQINAMRPDEANKILRPLSNNIRVAEGTTPKANIEPFKRTGQAATRLPLRNAEKIGLFKVSSRKVDAEGNVTQSDPQESNKLVGRAINPTDPAQKAIANKAAQDSGDPEKFTQNLTHVQEAIADGKEVNFQYDSARSEVEGSPTNQERGEAQELSNLNLVPKEVVQKTLTPTSIETTVEPTLEPVFSDLSAMHAKSRAVEEFTNSRKRSLKANFPDIKSVHAAIDEVIKAREEKRPVQGLSQKQVKVIHDNLLDQEYRQRFLINGYSQDKVIANAKNLTDAISDSNLLSDPELRRAYEYVRSGQWTQDIKDRNENMAHGYRGDGQIFLSKNEGGKFVDRASERRIGEGAPAAKRIDDWKVQILNAMEGGTSPTFYEEANANAATANRPTVNPARAKTTSTNPFHDKLKKLGDSLYLARGEHRIRGVGEIISPASETLRLDRVESAKDNAPVELLPSEYSQRAAGFMPETSSPKTPEEGRNKTISLVKTPTDQHNRPSNETEQQTPSSRTPAEQQVRQVGNKRRALQGVPQPKPKEENVGAGTLRGSGLSGSRGWQQVDRRTGTRPSSPEQFLSGYLDHVTTEAGNGTYKGNQEDLLSYAGKAGNSVRPDLVKNLKPYEIKGGIEHRVFLPPKVEGENRSIYKTTRVGNHGFGGDEVSYLKYVDNMNKLTGKKLDIKVLGVEPDNSQGKEWPNIVTKMNYIEGHVPGNDTMTRSERQAYLEKRLAEYGFEKIGGPVDNDYKHKDTGLIIEDAHLSNIMELANGDLVPFDVHVKGDISKPMFMPEVNEQGFYSQAEKNAEEGPNKATVAQWHPLFMPEEPSPNSAEGKLKQRVLRAFQSHSPAVSKIFNGALEAVNSIGSPELYRRALDILQEPPPPIRGKEAADLAKLPGGSVYSGMSKEDAKEIMEEKRLYEGLLKMHFLTDEDLQGDADIKRPIDLTGELQHDYDLSDLEKKLSVQPAIGLLTKLDEAEATPWIEETRSIGNEGKNPLRLKSIDEAAVAGFDAYYGHNNWLVKLNPQKGFAGKDIYFAAPLKKLLNGEKLNYYWQGDTHLARTPNEIRNLDPNDYIVQRTFDAEGTDEAYRLRGGTITPNEMRVHIQTDPETGVHVVRYATWDRNGKMPNFIETYDIQMAQLSALKAVEAMEDRHKQGQFYGVDVVRARNKKYLHGIAELNPAMSSKEDPEGQGGLSGFMADHPMSIDAYVSGIRGELPFHARLARLLLAIKVKDLQKQSMDRPQFESAQEHEVAQ